MTNGPDLIVGSRHLFHMIAWRSIGTMDFYGWEISCERHLR